MFKRNLVVAFKPLKNNTVLLPDSYYRLISTYENACLCMAVGNIFHYASWAPYGSTVSDKELGINEAVASAIGLAEGDIVKCSLATNVMTLKALHVSAETKKDWEMLELTSHRIQSTLLDQTRIVNKGQTLIVWINRAIYVRIKINKLEPDCYYGRIEHNTELYVAPFIESVENSPERIPTTIPTMKPTKPSKTASTLTANALQKAITSPSINGFARRSEDKPSKPEIDSSDLPNVTKPMTNGYGPKPETNTINIENTLRELQMERKSVFTFRAIEGKWTGDTSQMCDVFLTRHNLPDNIDTNQIFLLKSMEGFEYYVNIKVIGDDEVFPHNVYPSIEINEILMKKLGIEAMERVTLKTKATAINFAERVILHPSKKIEEYKTTKEIEESFKKYIVDNTRLFPVLLNQDQIFKLPGDTYITVKVHPESLRYCLLDSDFLRECKIYCSDEVKDIKKLMTVKSHDDLGLDCGSINVEKFESITANCIEQIKNNLCLDERNDLGKNNNVLIVGPTNSGKSIICHRIIDDLVKPPYYCYFDIFFCARSKGRKLESIQKDLTHILVNCLRHAPSILLLDNLDGLARCAGEQPSQDSDYFNKVSDIIQQLISEFTKGNTITVIATCTSVNNLNRRIYASRGKHLFQHIENIPTMEKADREGVIRELSRKMKTRNVNYTKFSNLTEGYSLGDLVQFTERAVYYACKAEPDAPIITNDVLTQALENTNSYCLKGINNNKQLNGNDDDSEFNDNFAGLESVVSVLEEVLIWPSKYPTIFNDSPLRNQAGVLLFGPPGTGKTYLVNKIAKKWDLRMIQVKGPELLAKYIGQSEENVRNLFEKARKAKPCVLFFDEFDSLAPRRGHDSTGVTDRVVNQLLTELDGVESLQGVTVIAATSRPELLDPALLRSGRIDRLVECSLPDKEARFNIFTTLSRSLLFDKSVSLKHFADVTDNFTGADIQSILTTANMIAVKKVLAIDSENVPETITITQVDLLEAYGNTRPSLSLQDIIKYKQTYARFANKDKKLGQQMMKQRTTLA